MNLVLLLFIALFYKHGKIEYKLCQEKLHKNEKIKTFTLCQQCKITKNIITTIPFSEMLNLLS